MGYGLVLVWFSSLQTNFFYILILQPGIRLFRPHSLSPFPEGGAATGDSFSEDSKAFRTCLFLLGFLPQIRFSLPGSPLGYMRTINDESFLSNTVKSVFGTRNLDLFFISLALQDFMATFKPPCCKLCVHTGPCVFPEPECPSSDPFPSPSTLGPALFRLADWAIIHTLPLCL